MANIPGLKKVGPFWHYSLQVNGQRAHGSTKATDLTTARRVLEEKRRELLHGQLNLTKKVPPTLNQIWETWWRVNQTAFSRSYLVTAECRYRRWIKPNLGTTRVDRIQTGAVMAIRACQLEAGLSARYSNNTLELIRTLARNAIKSGHMDQLPFVVKFLRIQKKPRITIPTPRLSEFLAAVDAEARNPHVRIMLRVMVGLGMRETEVLGMRWEWLDLENQTYTVGLGHSPKLDQFGSLEVDQAENGICCRLGDALLSPQGGECGNSLYLWGFPFAPPLTSAFAPPCASRSRPSAGRTAQRQAPVGFRPWR